MEDKYPLCWEDHVEAEEGVVELDDEVGEALREAAHEDEGDNG